MNNQERDIISGIFQRLEQSASQARDPEAERLIADKIRLQPYAPYAMAQSLYVQEEALKNLGQQVEQLQAEVARLREQGSGSGGFLSSIFGGGARPQPDPSARQAPPGYAQQQPPGGPWGQQAPPQQQGGPWANQGGGYAQQQPQARGSGFLGTALTTAAGVAGGMVVGNALMNAFSGGSHHALGDTSGLGSALHGTSGDSNSGYQNASYDDPQTSGYQNASYDDNSGGGGDAGYQDASYDDGGDSGGGSDDYA